jgi:hypothetical protein
MHGADATGILGGKGGDHRAGIATGGRNGLDVGLNAGATTAVGSGDGEHYRLVT